MENERLSRRDFLKLFGAAIGAGALAACEKYIDIPTQIQTATPTEQPTVTSTPVPTETPTPTPTNTETPTPLATETEHLTTPQLMLLGDSLIALGNIPTILSQELEAAGLPVEFVGDRVTWSNTVPAEGHGGFNTVMMAQQIQEESQWCELNGKCIPNNFSQHIPDIVIIQLDTNDAINATVTDWNPVPVYEKYMTEIVNYLRSKNPSVKIIIPKLIPSLEENYDEKIILINNDIDSFVAGLNTANSQVATTKDLREIWAWNDFRDYVHPNPSGQQKLAQAYFDALVENKFLVK